MKKATNILLGNFIIFFLMLFITFILTSNTPNFDYTKSHFWVYLFGSLMTTTLIWIGVPFFLAKFHKKRQ
jgi:hypothetical protein